MCASASSSSGSSSSDDAGFVAASKELKETAALDQFIDRLIAATSQEELTRLVAENLLSCSQKFWIRLATRSDSAASQEEKAKLAALAKTVMYLVEAMVKKTEGQLSESAETLQQILVAAAEPNGEWNVPLADDKVEAMRLALEERAGKVDEALLSNAFAWMRKASDENLDGMVSLLQKVLQLYAARELSRGPGGDGATEQLLVQVLGADEAAWDGLIRGAAAQGGVSESSFMEALQRRMEATVLGLTSGSYAQRVQAEYLKEVEAQAKAVFKQLATGGTS